jgi:VanZ family protein
MRSGLRWSIWAGFVALFTTVLLLPGATISSLHGPEMTEGSKFLVAKTIHVAAYAVLTILSAWLFVPVRFRLLLLAFVMAHGTATELLQHLVPGRSGSLYDVGFDQLGVFIGLALSWKWWTRQGA